MFDYLSANSPAHFTLRKGYNVGQLREASDYYREHDLVKELRVVAGRASLEEAVHYRQLILSLQRSAARVVTEYIDGDRELSEPVVMALLELSARLRFIPEWGMIDGLVQAETVGARLQNSAGGVYLAILALTSMNHKLYANFWRQIETAGQQNIKAISAVK